MIKKLFSILLCAALLLTGSAQAGEPRPIGVSILPLQAFVAKVFGSDDNVVLAVPQDASPESYEPSPIEMKKLSTSLLYFSIGMPTEASKIIPFLSTDTQLIRLDEEVAAVYPDLTIDGDRDPHIWLSIKRVKLMIDAMEESFSALFPEQAEQFRKNAEAYHAELDATDEYIRNALRNIKDNKFIAFHPAFQYFAEDYGLEMYALEEHGKEATAKMLERMLGIAKEYNIRVIFMQDEVSARQAEAFASAIGGRVLTLSPLAYDYTDNLKLMADTLAEVLSQ